MARCWGVARDGLSRLWKSLKKKKVSENPGLVAPETTESEVFVVGCRAPGQGKKENSRRREIRRISQRWAFNLDRQISSKKKDGEKG